MKLLLSFSVVMMMTGVAFAGAPGVGVYTSVTQGGPVLDGHYSESWLPAGGAGQIGNTINAQSWDGVSLATEWKFYCPSIAIAPVLIENSVDGSGSGDVVYQTEYAGGLFWMSKDGPWGDGTEDYFGQLDVFSVETTYKYVFGTLLGIRSNVTMAGHFLGYENCLNFVITNASQFGDTDVDGPLPVAFPPFLDLNCDENVITRGSWGDITHIAMQITGSCIVGTEDTTWGGVKARYR